MKPKSNFELITFNITAGDNEYAIGLNQTLYIKYVEDIQSATKRMEIQITDSETGICSLLRGMEQVYLEIVDDDENLIGGYYIIYDIHNRIYFFFYLELYILLFLYQLYETFLYEK